MKRARSIFIPLTEEQMQTLGNLNRVQRLYFENMLSEFIEHRIINKPTMRHLRSRRLTRG